MTPEKENELFQAIGSIQTGIINLNSLLEAHTKQDSVQFAEMAASVQGIDNKMTSVAKDLAVKEALDTEKEKQATTSANRRATVVGSVAGFVVSMVTTWLQVQLGGK